MHGTVLLGAALSVSSVFAASCGSERGTTPIGTSSGTGGGGGSGGGLVLPMDSGPPPIDASGLCGNAIHPIVSDTPNVVFVFDTSGSMATIAQGSSTRYTLVRNAAVDLVHHLGPLINPGAARFPSGSGGTDGCEVGEIVMSVSVGDDGGPTTHKFEQATLMTPGGGTPLAASLKAMEGPLSFVPGRTLLVLATDGGPNCDYQASCTIDQCQANIEGDCPTPSQNCCAPNGPAGPSDCNDTTASVAAVKAFADAGIPVYVVGIPGSDAYGNVLDQLAQAGGGARATEPYYYKVDDLSNLAATFGSIASLAISCDFTIADAPPDPTKTNVYLDSTVLPYGPTNGWTWTSDTTLELHGQACQELKSGQVKQVQIVSGCPTVGQK